MTIGALELEHLPRQKALVESAYDAFYSEKDVVAAVLLGSLSSGKGDRISDADIVVFTQNNFHKALEPCFTHFEANKDIFYRLEGEHNENACFKKYIFNDLTSAEIHCLDLCEPFKLSKPFKTLFDKADVTAGMVTDEPAPKHEDFPVYTSGDQGLIWELFDCIKWLSRDNHELAKSYLKKLSEKL
ncbi:MULTISPECIES: hypothetical protein [Vibrio]|uniref:hypothetical protein n=1 Tax=Vibrio TaxID=662 RepID=UPI001F1BF0C4|nr:MULTISPECIES: hypothetical protein [Vibrio]MCF7476596.1 hypothetical protein [Vibrio sp. J2-4]MCR9579699.1 hypothetical protein [Vibrio antiquarius]MCR9617297.1 hypothetical protein [Vibrio antiquarius]